MAGAYPWYAAKEDRRSVDRQAPQCDEETGRGRRMGAEKNEVGRAEVSGLRQGRRHGETQAVPLTVLEGGQEPDV